MKQSDSNNPFNKTATGETLFVISEMGIGDGLTLLPAIAALRKLKPGIRIRMLAPGLWPLKDNVSSMVEMIDPALTKSLSESERLDWMLRENFRWVWNTENERSPWRPAILAADNPGWISSPAHRTWPRRSVLRTRRDQLRALFPGMETGGFPRIELTASQRDACLLFRSEIREKTLFALHPGAKDGTKFWPLEKFSELALRLANRPDTGVLIFLGPGESGFPIPSHPRIRRILLPLDEALPILAACGMLIGNDSGFYHLAHALGMPAVALFRSQRNRQIWAYRSPRSRAIWFYLPSPIRRHWHRFVSVGRVERSALGLITPRTTNAFMKH
jgi:ADP-heptose:LPS heptosyltransferase